MKNYSAFDDDPELAKAHDYTATMSNKTYREDIRRLAKAKCEESIALVEKKISVSERRRSFKRTNILFETSRA